jgi:CHAD domain-containing protein
VPSSELQANLSERMQRWLADLILTLDRVAAGEREPELFHATRTTIRRLRSGLDRGVRQIATDTGAVRDADVLLEDIAAQRASPDATPAAIGPALDVLADEAAERREVGRLGLVERLSDPGLKPQLEKGVKAIDRLIAATPETAVLAAALGDRGLELTGQVSSAVVAACHETWHQVRLAVKRVRYIVELVAGRDAEVLEGLVKMQSVLGKAHDHRVWEAHARSLRKSLAHRGPDVLPRAGLAQVADRHAAQAIAMEVRLGQDWDESVGPNLRANLMQALGVPVEPSAAVVPPAGEPAPAHEGSRA